MVRMCQTQGPGLKSGPWSKGPWPLQSYQLPINVVFAAPMMRGTSKTQQAQRTCPYVGSACRTAAPPSPPFPHETIRYIKGRILRISGPLTVTTAPFI